MTEWARGAFDVRSQRCVKLSMKSGVIANDIDNRRVSPQCIVQVRQTVGEPWTEMQQRDRRPIEHAAVAICGPRYHAFEQSKHAAHIADPIKGSDEMHFRRARVGKTDLDVIAQQGSEQTLGTIHK